MTTRDSDTTYTYTYDAWGNVALTWVNSLATNLYLETR